ncbi:hypothetical protein [Bacillus sp. PS06]|uniref:hypothetical protein n=1 Tax=Bacillus sp. PS06 TaxID=2764176 RepID=UPI001783FE4A|nr:hypothetical protein [Bacillus sp. PS06]MBD8070676.1 hypothetical protein [Bacillus sp. PS06]
MKRKTLYLLVFFGDIIAILLLSFYIFVFHFLSFGSFLFDSPQDEKIVMRFSEWILPIIIFGILSYIYIKHLWGKNKYKKMKIYYFMIGFGISSIFNVIWALLHSDIENLNNLFVQLSGLGVTVLLIFCTNSERKKLFN